MTGAFDYTINASDPDGGTLSFSLVKGPDGMTVDSATGHVTWTAGFVSAPVQVAVSDGQGGRVVHGFYVFVNTPLTSSQALSVAASEQTTAYASIDVPDNTLVLQVSLRGGIGDADLYVTDPNGLYVGESFRVGNTETLSIPTPKAGTWGVEVNGYRNYSGVQLLGVIPTPAPIPFPGTLTGLSGDFTSETYYKVSVPAGASGLVIKTSGGTGNVDVLVRQGAAPACSTASLLVSSNGSLYIVPEVIAPCVAAAASVTSGNTELVSVDTPTAADF